MVSLALPVDSPTLSSVSVAHVTRGTHVTAAACFLLLAALFFASFVVDLDALIAGDLRREFA